MTPEQFLKAVNAILEKHSGDCKMSHIDLDDLMAEVLRSLGYGDGVQIIENSKRRYA